MHLIFWLIVAVILIRISFTTLREVKNFKTAGLIFTVSALVPVVVTFIACNGNPSSEACVWGKSLIYLQVGLMILFVAPLVYLLTTVIYKKYKKLK